MKQDNKKKGWVRRYRSIQNHWLYQIKPFSKLSAWDDLVLIANHGNKKIVIGNEVIECKRGEIVTSDKRLMERWGWSKSKVRAFLITLEKDSMLVTKRSPKKTTLKICQYSDYQDIETDKEPQKDRKKTAKRPKQ